MSRDFDIKGGAGQFEAAVIAVVIDRIAREETAARQGLGRPMPGLSAWVRVLAPDEPRSPRDMIIPD